MCVQRAPSPASNIYVNLTCPSFRLFHQVAYHRPFPHAVFYFPSSFLDVFLESHKVSRREAEAQICAYQAADGIPPPPRGDGVIQEMWQTVPLKMESEKELLWPLRRPGREGRPRLFLLIRLQPRTTAAPPWYRPASQRAGSLRMYARTLHTGWLYSPDREKRHQLVKSPLTMPFVWGLHKMKQTSRWGELLCAKKAESRQNFHWGYRGSRKAFFLMVYSLHRSDLRSSK